MSTYNGHNEDSSGNILLSIGNGMAATVETGSTASQAYTKGALLFFNNRLCKATKAISSGATLAVGTNLSQTSLGAELTSHLRSSDGKEFYFDVKDGTYGYYPSACKVSSEFVPFGGAAQEATATCSLPLGGAGEASTTWSLPIPIGTKCVALIQIVNSSYFGPDAAAINEISEPVINGTTATINVSYYKSAGAVSARSYTVRYIYF